MEKEKTAPSSRAMFYQAMLTVSVGNWKDPMQIPAALDVMCACEPWFLFFCVMPAAGDEAIVSYNSVPCISVAWRHFHELQPGFSNRLCTYVVCNYRTSEFQQLAEGNLYFFCD
jgi:hypothetical protein